MSTNLRPVLVVGSVPLESSSAVFNLLSSKLGTLAKRLPDGETGPRRMWIRWQAEAFAGAKGLQPGSIVQKNSQYKIQLYKPAPGEQIEFGPLGYAQVAIRSYHEFQRLRSEGRIAASTRFQVCLPTPIAVMFAFAEPTAIKEIWPAYEKRLIQEITEIAAAIPAQDLAVQWDCAGEPVYVLSQPEQLAVISEESLIASIARMSDYVPAGAEIGLHLCIGDFYHKHMIEPEDLGVLVDFANHLLLAIKHLIAWVHFPVPRERDYDKYLAPLKRLNLTPGMELYLGIIHRTDGLEGALRRLAAAKRVVSNFGVGAECGMGRRPPETIANLLDLHKEVAASG